VVFGPAGVWKDFLSRAEGYIDTMIECESVAERRYRIRDFWTWHRNFEVFRQKFAVEYERFEGLISAEGLVEREQFVGAYYENRHGDEDEWVPG
jgi:hypothetical protein